LNSRREFVRVRANRRCEYCHLPEALSGAAFHVEHIHPSSRGGSDEEWNLALSCARCNEKKGFRFEGCDPRTGKTVPFFHPRRDRWDCHFRWSLDGKRILGRTPVGRATVAALDLNGKIRQRLRGIWRERLTDLFPFE
jgi:hypothetical protein